MPVTLLTPLALVGLGLLAPLILLRFRQRLPRHEVATTLLWRELLEAAPQSSSGARLTSLPLLLLQALALTLLVLSLARPATDLGAASSTQPIGYHAFILDDSLRMTATDLHPSRLAVAKQLIARRMAGDPAHTVNVVVVATAQPYLLISSADRSAVRRALRHLAPPSTSADLADALRLSDGLVPHGGARRVAITILRAWDDPQPPVTDAAAGLSSIALGASTDNQAIARFSARCGTDGGGPCTAFALIRNEAYRPVTDLLVLLGDGDQLAHRSLLLPSRSATGLAVRVPAGRHVLELRLTRPDVLPLDNIAWCVVPSPYRTRVALVGAPARVAPVRKALLSLPDVDLTMSPRFALAQASSSDVVILDGQAPPPQLPAVPEMILIDPPSLPGGRALGDAADTAVSGVDAANPLLSGVDITSLDVPAGTAERLSPPSWMQPVIWTASGPLLASGEDAGQRVAVLAFDPARTNLPQLSAFPLLLRNLLRWGWDDVPESAPLGSDVLVSPAAGATQVEIAGPYLRRDAAPTQPTALTITPARPGIYTVIERGPWGIRIERMAVNATAGPSPSPGERLELGLPGAVPADAGASTPAGPRPWWPWIGLAALIALAAEWSFVMAQGRG